ncbi:PilZ domain-containing protein [Accumulibacter sp.]|uniref:PilZ domain-containing protein n=1 Tax=Accumulibacter sp. TaxID=2053492 RepID=UPI0025852991|nr:PilZ domain-containing protein [Accumulibacter sp.]MCM8578805.1 PilZ domain-containing protein [Accumulibacter sp.]
MRETRAVSEERRQYSRISFASPAQLLLVKRTLEVQVLDLSLKGALLHLPAAADLAMGEAADLDLPLDEMGNRIRMQATVAHLEGRQAGLACRIIDIDSVTHLRRLVELNLGDAELLQRELAVLLAE